MVRVHGPDAARPYLRPWPGSDYGVQRFSYGTNGAYVIRMANPAYIDPRVVAAILRGMQETVPLGALGQFDLFCLDMHLLATSDPAMGYAEGIAHPGWIAISGHAELPEVRDLITHEITHGLASVCIDRGEEAEFFAHIGQVVGSNTDTNWARRPQERLAEYLSLALWGEPLREDIPPLTPAQVAWVREWALQQFSGYPVVPVVVDGEALESVITMQVDNPWIDVNGRRVFYDVAPKHIDPPGRLVVPARFCAEELPAALEAIGIEGFTVAVEWDEPTKTARFRFKRTQ